MKPSAKKIHIEYFAVFREKRGLSEETIETQSQSAIELFEELRTRHGFPISRDSVKVAINNEFAEWQSILQTNDSIVFIPPVAGG